jgi:ferric-dicitrate binding protein FerR (iron transport regulator)
MKVTPQLIECFFKNTCSADEADAVSAYLNDHPDQIGQFLQENEWDNNTLSSMDDDRKQAIFHRLQSQLKLKRSKQNTFFRFVAAASVLLVITTGVLMKNKQSPAQLSKKADVVYTLVKINYGNEDLPLKLEDGSFILLKPSSELQYPEHFKGKVRSFSLKGEARFKVAKDPKHPFIVHAGGTTTTALGTEFTISAQPDAKDIKIALHEGKVVVKSDRPNGPAAMKDVYLLAGEEFSVDKNTHLASLSRSKPNPVKRPTFRVQPRSAHADMVFNNQSLRAVYNVLEQEFNVHISSPEAEISDRYFTGSFKRDGLTVEQVIQEIALLNDFKVEKRNGVYHLRKKPYTNEKAN